VKINLVVDAQADDPIGSKTVVAREGGHFDAVHEKYDSFGLNLNVQLIC
jgi:hypothetical protein